MSYKSLIYSQRQKYEDKLQRIFTSHNPALIAVMNNNVARLVQLRVEEHFSFTTIFSERHSLLHIAAYANSVAALDYLCQLRELDVNMRNSEGWTPLFVAAALRRSPDATLVLLDAGALADVAAGEEHDGITALELLLCGPRRNTEDARRIAVQLMERSPPPDAAGGGAIALHLAALCNPTRLFTLLALGAPPDQFFDGGYTPLHMAAGLGDSRVVEALLEAGADPNLKTDKFHMSALMVGAHAPPRSVVAMLKHGAIVDDVDCFNTTIVHDAVHLGRVSIIHDLVLGVGGHKALSRPGPAALPPLIQATRSTYKSGPKMVKALLEAGAQPNIRGRKATTALHGAARNRPNGGRMAGHLLYAGADPEAVSTKGTTPLLSAVHHNNTDVALALLIYGADATRPVGRHRSPFLVALEHRLFEVQRLMLAFYSDLAKLDVGVHTALGFAIQYGSPEASLMLELGATKCSMSGYVIDKAVNPKRYTSIFDQIGWDNFPVNIHETLLAFTIVHGPEVLFSHMLHSDQLPEVLDDCYARRDQGILEYARLVPVRSVHYPSTQGIVDYILEHFLERQATEMIYLLMSYGYEPDVLEAWMIFSYQAQSPAFNAIIDLPLYQAYMPKNYLMPTIVLDFTKSIREHINYWLENKAPVLNLHEMMINAQSVGPFFSSFRLLDLFRNIMLEHGVSAGQLPVYLRPRMATLMEICRDYVRDTVRETCDINTYHDYCLELRSLGMWFYYVPEVLMYRQPLYGGKLADLTSTGQDLLGKKSSTAAVANDGDPLDGIAELF